MVGTSTSDVRTTTSTSDYDIALSVINKQLRSLRKKHNRILRMEESVSQGKPLNKEQEEVLESKSITFDCIEELEMLTEEGRGSVVKAAAPHVMLGSFLVPLDGSSMPVLMPDEPKTSAPKLKQERSRMNGSMNKEMSPVEKERYLCVTDGVVICCLDLKHSKDESNGSAPPPQPVTKISSLKLLEMGLPISIGLFKLGSDVYMIGGQEFPGFKKDPNSWGKKLLNDLYSKQSVRGSSCDTYRVCLSNGSLSILECNIRPMNLPKFWPIVEKIDDKIHVIESLPSELGFYCPDTIPSHEILDLNDLARGWTLLSPNPEEDEEFDFHVSSHIVVGDRIYAGDSDQCVVFDSKTTKWQRESLASFYFRSGMGARQFLAGESEEPLYVVIGVGEEFYPVKKQGLRAHLVSCKTGRLIGEQFLPDILEGFEQPFTVSQGTLVDVDGEEGKTMCVVLHVNTDGGCRGGFLYMSVFSMEEVEDAEAGEWRENNYYTRTKEFVKVVVKQRYIYKLDEYLGEDDDIGESVRLGACFL